MRLCKSYELVIKVSLKTWILELLHPQFVSLKTVKDESLSFWEKPFWYIFTTKIKVKKNKK